MSIEKIGTENEILQEYLTGKNIETDLIDEEMITRNQALLKEVKEKEQRLNLLNLMVAKKVKIMEDNIDLIEGLIYDFLQMESYWTLYGRILDNTHKSLKLKEQQVKIHKKNMDQFLEYLEIYATYCLGNEHYSETVMAALDHHQNFFKNRAKINTLLLVGGYSGGERELLLARIEFPPYLFNYLRKNYLRNSINKFIYFNLYKIQLDEMEVEGRLYLQFQDYQEIVDVGFAPGEEKYYLLPQTPSKIMALQGNHLIRLEEKGIKITKVKDSPSMDLSNYTNIVDFVYRVREHRQLRGEMISRILFFNMLREGIRDYEKDTLIIRDGRYLRSQTILEDLREGKDLYSQDFYLDCLNNVLVSHDRRRHGGSYSEKSGLETETIEEIRQELLSYEISEENLRIICEEKEFNEALKYIKIAYDNKLSIPKDSFQVFMERVYHQWQTTEDSNYLKVELAIICEDFICHYNLPNINIVRYLELIYNNKKLFTDRTMEVVARLSTYFDEEMIIELLLLDKVEKGIYDIEFFENLLQYSRRKGKINDFITYSVNALVRSDQQESFSDQNKFKALLEILEEVYQRDEGNVVLLEWMVYTGLKKGIRYSPTYISKLFNHYLQTGIISEKSLLIAEKYLSSQLQHNIEFYSEILKYEVVHVNQSDIYKTLIINHPHGARILNPSGPKRLVEVGFTDYFQYEIDGLQKEKQRKVIKDNESIFIESYFRFNDQEARKNIATYVIHHNIYKKDILLDYIENQAENKSKAQYLLIKNWIKEDHRRAINYFNNILDDLGSRQGDEEILSNLVKAIFMEDPENAIRILLRIGEKGEKFKQVFEKNLQWMGDTVKVNDKINGLGLIFQKLAKNLNSVRYSKFVNYVGGIDEISSVDANIILEIYGNNQHLDVSALEKEIFLKTDTGTVGDLAYQLYRISNSPLMLKKALACCLKEPQVFKGDIIIQCLEEIKDDPEELLDFLEKVSFNGEHSAKLFEIASYHFINRQEEVARKILLLLKDQGENYLKIHEALQDEEGLIKQYKILWESNSDDYGSLMLAEDLFTGQQVEILKLSRSLNRIFSNYLDFHSLSHWGRIKSGHYLLKGSEKFNNQEKSLKELLEAIEKLLDLQVELRQQGKILYEFNKEDFYFIKGILIPEKIYQVRDFEGYIRVVDPKKNSSKMIKLEEKDIVMNFIEGMMTLLTPYKEEKIVEKLHGILKDQENFFELKTSYSLFMQEIKVVVEERQILDISHLLKNFELMEVEKQQKALQQIVESHRAEEEVYRLVFQHRGLIPNVNEKYQYLLKHLSMNYNDEEVIDQMGKLLADVKEEASDITVEDQELIYNLKDLIKNAHRSRAFNKKPLLEIVDLLRIFSSKDINEIHLFITRNNRISRGY